MLPRSKNTGPGAARRPGPGPAGVLDPETLAALEHATRLAEQGRTRESLAAVRRLNDAAPGQPAILGLLGILAARNGDPEAGLEHLAAALLRAPHDPEALYNLGEVYLQAGAPIHALHSLRSFRNEVQHVPVTREFPGVDDLIASLTRLLADEARGAGLPPEVQDRVMMAAERGRLRLLFNDAPDRAMPDLREAMRAAPRYAPPRNNLSLALFYHGEVAPAISTLEATLRDVDPDNVYALASLAFVRWASGAEPPSVRPLVERAVQVLGPESRLLDRTRVAEVAGVLGEHALALEIVQGAVAPESGVLEGASVQAARARVAAAALANAGQVEAAAAGLRAAAPAATDPLAKRLLAALETGEQLAPSAGGGYPYLRWDDLLSPHLLRRLCAPVAPRRRGLRAGPSAPAPEEVAGRLQTLFPRLPLACALLLWMGDPLLENLGLTLLALAGTPAADALLEEHLRGTAGSYSGRQQAGYALLDSDGLRNGTTVPFWSGTAWTEVRLFRLTPRRRDAKALQETLGTLLARVGAEPVS